MWEHLIRWSSYQREERGGGWQAVGQVGAEAISSCEQCFSAGSPQKRHRTPVFIPSEMKTVHTPELGPSWNKSSPSMNPTDSFSLTRYSKPSRSRSFRSSLGTLRCLTDTTVVAPVANRHHCQLPLRGLCFLLFTLVYFMQTRDDKIEKLRIVKAKIMNTYQGIEHLSG